MAIQKTHHEYQGLPATQQIVLLAENIRTPENMGMIFRVAEAFGVSGIIFSGSHGIELSTKAKRASRTTYQKVQYSFEESTVDSLLRLQKEGFSPIALEITTDSIPIQEFAFADYTKVALIIGSERQGISEEALKLISKAVHIPLYGSNSSINVVSALSIALQEISR